MQQVLENVEQRVQKLHDELQAFKKQPGTWHVMRYYLNGRGFSMYEIDRVLGGVQEFMDQFKPKKKL